MNLLTSEQRDALLDTFEHNAFHLELKDSYGVEEEDESYAKWRRGEPDDLRWFQAWLDRMRAATRSGKAVRRIRVITEPITDYIRFEHTYTGLNQEAGEDIRWLPRHQVPAGTAFPVSGNDWWLFDNRSVAVGHFHQDGSFKGSELITDPAVVADCIKIRDQLWPIAIPHDDYRPA